MLMEWSTKRKRAAKFRRHALIFLALTLAIVPLVALGGNCMVPGTHDSIQAAVDDPDCSDIELDNRNYLELLVIDRSLTLSGPMGGSATIVGQVQVTGATTLVTLSDFRVKGGCPDGVLRVTGGGQTTAAAIQVVFDSASGCDMSVFFRNGFENQL